MPHPWADRILCLDRFAASPLLFTPGERYSYSTFGYMLAGAVIERAGELPFEEQVAERIFEPLGMRHTQPDYPWLDIPHRAVGYRGLRIGLATLDEELDVSWKLSAGGWISTIEDFGRFATGLLNETLLEPESCELMFSPKLPHSGRASNYGYGIGTYSMDGVQVISHSGEQSMASTFLLLCPELGLGVCVLSNTANLRTRRIAQSLFRILREA